MRFNGIFRKIRFVQICFLFSFLILNSCSRYTYEETGFIELYTNDLDKMKGLLFDKRTVDPDVWRGPYQIITDTRLSLQGVDIIAHTEDFITGTLYSKDAFAGKGVRVDNNSYRIYQNITKYDSVEFADHMFGLLDWEDLNNQQRFWERFENFSSKFPLEDVYVECEAPVENVSERKHSNVEPPYTYCTYLLLYDQYLVDVSVYFNHNSPSMIKDMENLFRNIESKFN